jgi:spermidine/putrescine transport system permease protein
MRAIELEREPSIEAEPPKRRRLRKPTGGPWKYLALPTVLLVVFFVLPMAIMVQMSLLKFPPNTSSGYTFAHYTAVLGDPLYRKVALNTAFIATAAQLLMLVIGVPLAYVMAFKAGKWELLILLLLVLADELNPIIKIYAWRIVLGKEGIINSFLISVGLIKAPIAWLLFDRFAVIVTLAASWITYTTIPIYAAMKAINPSLFEAAVDLGASWWTQARRVLIPLAAPGFFIAMILVYIPLFTDFVTPTLVGGVNSYMLGNAANDLILGINNWGEGSALNLILLVLSIVLSVIAYYLARLNRIET